jgi:hypothetical protein
VDLKERERERKREKEDGFSHPCDGGCAVGVRIHATTSNKRKQGKEEGKVFLLVEVKILYFSNLSVFFFANT